MHGDIAINSAQDNYSAKVIKNNDEIQNEIDAIIGVSNLDKRLHSTSGQQYVDDG